MKSALKYNPFVQGSDQLNDFLLQRVQFREW